MSEMVETPHRLRDVADPCMEIYYPEWSSRGMRRVRCTRPAKGTARKRHDAADFLRVCGLHARVYRRHWAWTFVPDARP